MNNTDLELRYWEITARSRSTLNPAIISSSSEPRKKNLRNSGPDQAQTLFSTKYEPIITARANKPSAKAYLKCSRNEQRRQN